MAIPGDSSIPSRELSQDLQRAVGVLMDMQSDPCFRLRYQIDKRLQAQEI